MAGEDNISQSEPEASQQQQQQSSDGPKSSLVPSIFNEKETEWITDAEQAFRQSNFDSKNI